MANLIAPFMEELISEIPEDLLTEVYTRIKLEEKLEGYRNK